MKNPREKYLNDNMYRTLVDTMVEQINRCNYTPSEMREAAVLASTIYEERVVNKLYANIKKEEIIIDKIFIDGKIKEEKRISEIGVVLTPTRFDETEKEAVE